MANGMYNRTKLLLGSEAMERLRRVRVIIFGVGGVGSWCAESLLRTGVTHLTLVDADVVAETNLNRQLMATVETIGRPKVEALKERLLSINPEVEIEARQEIYTAETAERFRLEEYDYVIDAIDSLQPKADLILHATRVHVRLFSSMGAALKLDPTRVKVAEFWKVTGCPLAAALRNKFKRTKQMPRRKFQCVYSDELLRNQGVTAPDDGSPEAFHKVQTNGSLVHITAIFGFTLAGLVISHQQSAISHQNEKTES